MAPVLENLPSSHSSHVNVALFRYSPPEQNVHETEALAVLNSPMEQFLQDTEPAVELNVLTPHFEQEVAPVVEEE